MKQLKLLLLTVIGLLYSVSMSAYDFKLDGMYYNITSATDKTVEVTHGSDARNSYSGAINIPNTVNYLGEIYTVTCIGNYAFYGCYGLTSVVIPNSVTSIGDWAFGDCSSLTSVVIPNSVTSIGDLAFANCSGLTSVEIPNSVTSIGEATFGGCYGLTSVVIPNSVTSIGNDAFGGCSSLTSVVIPNSVTSIGNDAFGGCSSLTSVVIPNSVTSIGDGAFRGCFSLTSVEIPNSVTSIGEATFRGCYGLTSVVIPNSVTSIGNDAFGGCSGLTSVVIGNSVTSIGNDAFGGCSSLTSVVIGNSVTSIGNDAFGGCSSLTSVEIPNSVTSIGDGAFCDCYGLTSVEIPNSVTSIGDGAFSYCSGLTSLVIPNSVTSIGKEAFCVCSGLTSIAVAEGNPTYDSRDNCNAIIETQTNTLIAGCSETTIPNSVTSIGEVAFYYCYGLTSVEIPNSVTSIGDGAFSYCSGLTSLVIPNSVTSIGKEAFCVCSGLTSIAVAEGNPTYDSRDNCNAIIETQTNTLIAGCSETTIPNSVTSIGEVAFGGCFSLTSVEIPNSVTSIGSSAFAECSGLTSVVIPNSVTSIGSSAFFGCSSLTSVVIPESVTSIGDYAFYRCEGLTSMEIPNSVTSIGDHVFANCSGLTSVEIPNSVTSIGYAAFVYCYSLTSVEIPNSVTSIGDYAFDYCYGLTSVTSHIPANNLFPIKSNVFKYEDKSNCTLNVPYGAKEKYESTAGWNEFENIVELNKVESIHVDEQGVRYELNVINETFMAIGYTDDLSTDIVLPATIDGVTMSGIAAEAFKNAEIQTIVIPATIQEVGDDAFVGCTELRWVDWQAKAQVRAECFDAPEVHGNMLLFCYGEQAPDYAGNVVVNGKAREIVLIDARPYASPYDYEAENISFTKTFTKETMIGTGAGWEGIVVPFDVERIVFGDKVIAPFGATGQYCDIPCWLAQMKDENFVMTDAIKADEAYIMAVPNSEAYDDDYNVEGDVRFEATNAVVKATANSITAPANEHALVGTYEPVDIDADVFALNDDDYLDAEEDLVLAPGSVFVQGMREVRPFEAYVRSTKALQMACLKIGSVLPTHITSVQSGKTDAEAWYTLQGKRLNTKPVQTGFYLHGGKLEFVRQQ